MKFYDCLFEVFEICAKNNLPDLTLALAHYYNENPGTMGEVEDKECREFMGRHYEKLVEAYKLKDKEAFDAVVAECVKLDEEGKE